MKYSAIFAPVRLLASLAAASAWHLCAATALAGLTQVQTLDHVPGVDLEAIPNLGIIAINTSTGRLYVGGARLTNARRTITCASKGTS